VVAAPGDSRASVHKMRAGDMERLLGVLNSGKAKAERELGRPVEIVLCHDVGYDGSWPARLLIAGGARVVVFDPASFLAPRRGRRAKTDRLDAEGMTRTLRAWLGGNREGAREVRAQSVEQEDAKRIEPERKSTTRSDRRTSLRRASFAPWRARRDRCAARPPAPIPRRPYGAGKSR